MRPRRKVTYRINRFTKPKILRHQIEIMKEQSGFTPLIIAGIKDQRPSIQHIALPRINGIEGGDPTATGRFLAGIVREFAKAHEAMFEIPVPYAVAIILNAMSDGLAPEIAAMELEYHSQHGGKVQ